MQKRKKNNTLTNLKQSWNSNILLIFESMKVKTWQRSFCVWSIPVYVEKVSDLKYKVQVEVFKQKSKL